MNSNELHSKFNINNDGKYFSQSELDKIIINLYQYNNLRDFKEDIIKDINNTEYVIELAIIHIDTKDGSYKPGNIREHREYFNGFINFSIREYVYGQQYIQEKNTLLCESTNNTDSHDKVETCYSLYLSPKFIPDKLLKNITLRIDLLHLSMYNLELKKVEDLYPNVIDNRFIIHKGEIKEIDYIQALSCPCASQSCNSIKVLECKHHVFIYFKDNSNLIFWVGDPGVKVSVLESKGYIPFIIQYRPYSNEDYEKQLQECELAKKIGPSKQKYKLKNKNL